MALGKKVSEVFVGQDEIIAKCDKSDYLICLKEGVLREPPSFVLRKVVIWKNTIETSKFTVYELEEQFGKYFLSYSEKMQKVCLNMAYSS